MCKVSGNLETKDPSKALGHEGIAVKIKIKLQTESDDSHPRQRSGNTLITNGVYLIPESSKLIGKKNLKA